MNILSNVTNKVIFCKKCVESNQRFMGSIPHKDQPGGFKETASFDKNGVCNSCNYFENKKKINWDEREKELIDILEKYKRKDGYYDVLVPGSGGKDSRFVSHILKSKYNMNPLTCTWSPHLYTDIGWKNFRSWSEMGHDNVLFTPNGLVHRKLTQLAFLNLLHPFQPFVIGQHNLAPRIAIEKKIKLVIYGDSYAERAVGGNVYGQQTNTNNRALFSIKKSDEEIYFGGCHISKLNEYGITKKDLQPYLPLDEEVVDDFKLNVLVLPHYINYNPQTNFYYAKNFTNFLVNPDGRSEGTYTKYSSLDDKIDSLHYYTWFIKTGRGRATEDAAIEVRNGIINRDEAVALVKKYDGEFPKKYFKDILEYLDISESLFFETIDKFRPQHLWSKINNEWFLKEAVWKK